jgi:UDP-N-acetyl-D-mannosaminuronic acid dehydrogenase
MVMSVVEQISREAKTGALISIESTIPKGTSKKVFEKVDHRLHVVHAPHRWYALEEKKHGVNQLRIIGGVSNCCLRYGMRFYNGSSSAAASATTTSSSVSDMADSTSDSAATIMSSSSISSIKSIMTSDSNSGSSSGRTTLSLAIPMHPVSSIDAAELTKIIENAHRYLQIAFAEELYLYCKVEGIIFKELRDSLNTKWNVDILEPRDGIGDIAYQKIRKCL